MHDQTTAETRDSAKPADDQTGEVALRERIASAADHCRNALQMLLGLRLLADKVASLPINLLQPWFSQDLRILADSLERRLSQAVEELEGAWVQVGGEACPLLRGLARSSTYATVTRSCRGSPYELAQSSPTSDAAPWADRIEFMIRVKSLLPLAAGAVHRCATGRSRDRPARHSPGRSTSCLVY